MPTTPTAPAHYEICQSCKKDLWMENDCWESGICKSCQPRKVMEGNPLKDERWPDQSEVAYVEKDFVHASHYA